MTPESLARIERNNYVIGGVAVGFAAVAASQQLMLGVLVGAVVTAVNFSVMRRLVARVLWGPEQDRNKVALLFVPKMAVLMGAVSAAIYLLPISPIGFALGFSVFLVSIGIETVRFIAAPPTADVSDSSDPQP